MSNIEKIKAEIERRAKFHDDAMKACVGLNNIALTHSAGWKEDTEILTFIDSLPECEETAKISPEKYEEELNEEIHGFIDEYGYERGEDKILIAIVARHFVEWAKHKESLHISETCKENAKSLTSLEEAAEKIINDALYKWSYDDEDGIEQYVHDAFIAGAEWMRKKQAQ